MSMDPAARTLAEALSQAAGLQQTPSTLGPAAHTPLHGDPPHLDDDTPPDRVTHLARAVVLRAMHAHNDYPPYRHLLELVATTLMVSVSIAVAAFVMGGVVGIDIPGVVNAALLAFVVSTIAILRGLAGRVELEAQRRSVTLLTRIGLDGHAVMAAAITNIPMPRGGLDLVAGAPSRQARLAALETTAT